MSCLPVLRTRRVEKEEFLMTKITYTTYNERYYFEATGHAVAEANDAFGGYGCDETEKAVCAAVSVLMLTAAGRLAEMEARGDFISSCITVEGGYALFDIEPRQGSAEKTEEIIENLIYGIALLEENYPELVMIA